jgi:hypothetical protein
MPTFKSKLARYNCCEQVMPVPVIPKCAVSCCIPTPIIFANISNEYSHEIPNFPPIQEPVIGTILTNASGITPFGYLPCDGSSVSKITYSNLFSVIGTQYGDDTDNKFFLPNLEDLNGGVFYIIKF